MEVALARDYAPAARTVKTVCKALHIPLPPTGWHMSEKKDGLRAVWHQGKMLSRNGTEIVLPDGWACKLPPVSLDGELAVGSRQGSGLFRRKHANEESWRATGARFFVFDIYDPQQRMGPFEARMEAYRQAIVRQAGSSCQDVPNWVVPMVHIPCRQPGDADTYYNVVLADGGEGIVLRAPGSLYESGRTATLLKRKDTDTDTFVVQEVVAGRGKLQGRIGSIRVRRERDNAECYAGSVTDGSVGVGDRVVIKFMGVSDTGVPRNASFVELLEKASHGVH